MNHRILIVDDEPVNVALLEAILRPHGWETVSAVNGQEALGVLETERVDMMLLDVMMPVLDGYETLRRVRATAARATLPIVLVTAASDRAARLRGFELGADEFLEKPVDRALLLTRVRTLLALTTARAELIERARMLEMLHLERRELMDLIVHDLKNPLSVINTNLRYLEKKLPPGLVPLQEALLDATTASDRMKGLIVDLLSVERMDRAELQLRRQEVNVAALVEEVARTHRREAELQNLRVSTELSSNIGVVRADGDLLRRVVENLVENALHHTPQNGAIEIRVESTDELEIVISNTGAPIPAHLRDTLFAKFTRGEGDTRSRFGLGLYFCKRVATAHQGTMTLVDRLGWPVSFRFAVPAA